MGIQITPSILNADFANLGAEVARIPNADWVHVDVMDNHFVPNLTFGPTMVEALARSTDVPLDAHLMIEDPDREAAAYVEAGCGSVTFHVEACRAPVRLARQSAPDLGVDHGRTVKVGGNAGERRAPPPWRRHRAAGAARLDASNGPPALDPGNQGRRRRFFFTNQGLAGQTGPGSNLLCAPGGRCVNQR